MHLLTLSDIAEIIMGQSPKGEDCNSDPSGTPLLNGPTEFGPRYPVAVQFTSDPKRFSKAGDILFCVRGSTTGRMNLADRAYAIGRGIAAIRGKNGYPTAFVKGMIDSTLPSLLVQATGSTFPNVSREMLNNLKIPFVDPETAKQIAKILSSLDDKIELNRRMNSTLEAMARALFKAWFVEFEPVHANKENRPSTSASPEIAKLFPSDFENGIPKGWTFKPLGNIADVNWGDTSVTKQSYVSDGFSAYSASGSDGLLPYFDFDKTGIVVSAIGANSGLTWLARGKWSAIKNTITIFASDKETSTEYLYLSTIGKENWTLRGSAQPFLSQTDTRAKQILFPSENLGAIFGSWVEPLFELHESRKAEGARLAEIRDALLPRLIAGKIRV